MSADSAPLCARRTLSVKDQAVTTWHCDCAAPRGSPQGAHRQHVCGWEARGLMEEEEGLLLSPPEPWVRGRLRVCAGAPAGFFAL